MQKHIHWLLQSSQDPKKVAVTVKGLVLLAGTPAMIQLINYALGTVISAEQVEMIADQLGNLATQVAIVIGAVATAYGLIMKMVARVNEWLVNRHETVSH